MQITFTLDVEDHRADAGDDPRHVALTLRILEFLGERGIRGTFFVVGDVVDEAPDLLRAIAAEGHEVGLHSFRHVPLPDVDPSQFTTAVRASKARLEDLAQRRVVGFRAPIFSLVPEAHWVVDELLALGFEYSSSVMPIRHPLYGDPGCRTTPFRWPNGLLELPCPVLRVGRDGLPLLGAVWLRNLPAAATRLGLTMVADAPLLWTYAHPYDFDADEPFRVLAEAGRFGSRLLWRQRDRMFDRYDRLLRGRVAPPLAERIAALDRPIDVGPVGERAVSTPAMNGPAADGGATNDAAPNDAGQDQLSMLHRLPPARVVDRLDHVTRAATGRRVVHIGFADAGYHEMQEGAGTWLHARIAGVAAALVGLDVDEAGVARARAAGYEASVVDCRDPDAVLALGLEPADLVLAGEVIEHIDQPGPFLEAMHGLVAPGGRLLLTTPNASGLGNTLLALGGYEINHPDHVTLFSCRTLSALLDRHGWEADTVATYVPILKPLQGGGISRKVIAVGARTMLAFERGAGRLGAPFVADGLIVEARSTRA